MKAIRKRLLLATVLAGPMLVVPVGAAAHAQTATRTYSIAAQDLGDALRQFSAQSGRDVVFDPGHTSGRKSQAVQGALSADRALRVLLEGTGLTFKTTSAGFAIMGNGIEPRAGTNGPGQASEAEAEDPGNDDILVTGTRIRGAISASPRITITGAQLQEEGRTDLGEVIRDIPQNFNGGQNPGVLGSAGGTNIANQNVTSGSALNLRGLGPDATLTLLNGKRLTYSGFNNAVDLSAIPIAAVDRLEIVTDGASAIYGSDAVAGVANIILKRDYDGLSTLVRGMTTTRGGGDGYQVSVTGGTTWNGGGALLAYDRSKTDAIYARQRSFVAGFDDPTTLYPDLSRDSLLFTGHQRLGSGVTLSLDALYTRRENQSFAAFDPYLYDLPGKTRTLTVAPALEVDLPAGWVGRLVAAYGRDENSSKFLFRDLASGDLLGEFNSRYVNGMRSIDLGFEGPLATLPGGEIRLATGGGYRRNTFKSGIETSYGGSEESVFVYGEVNVPIVSPAMEVAGFHRFNLTGAVRHEDYRGQSGTTTPKIGLVYEPTLDFGLKGTWGRSFKVASLLQQYIPGGGFLTYANRLGGTGYPADAVVIYIDGPHQSLKPERAESWSATFAVHPRSIAGLNFEATLFKIDYTDRIQSPVNNIFQSLSEPAYAPFVILSPTPEQIAAALATAGSGFTNNVNGDPDDAVAIINNTYHNTASDRVKGIDVTGSYAFGLAGGKATVTGSGSFLKGRRQLLESGPTLKSSGIIFTPPRFRGRTSLNWDKDELGFTFAFNHLGGVLANYYVVDPGKTDSFNTIDLNLRYTIAAGKGLLSGTEFALTIDNALNAKPPLFEPALSGLPNYDSTNYSVIGRVVALTVNKSW